MKRTSTVVLYLVGLLLIVLAFFHFGKGLDGVNLFLNISVTTFIYTIWLFEPILPWTSSKDRSQKSIGSLGIKWFFLILYTIIALLVLVYNLFAQNTPSLVSQILVHGGLIFLYFFGVLSRDITQRAIQNTYDGQLAARSGIVEIRDRIRRLIEQHSLSVSPSSELIRSLRQMEEELRYVNPNKTSLAQHLEGNIIALIDQIEDQTKHVQVDWSALK